MERIKEIIPYEEKYLYQIGQMLANLKKIFLLKNIIF